MNAVDIRLYVLLDPGAVAREALPGIAADAVRGGATLLQYRDKTGTPAEKRETLRAVRAALAGASVPLLVNDDVETALAVDADGVHLGQDDMSPAEARAKLGPRAIIGRTIKNAAHVEKLAGEPVDYAFCGGVFPTVHKDNPDRPIGLAGLSSLSSRIRALRPGMPVGAIAGIGEDNVSDVIAAGAEGVAVIGAIAAAADPREAAHRLRTLIDAALARR
jgi:thiamine-phosphate pyrophosphorylase